MYHGNLLSFPFCGMRGGRVEFIISAPVCLCHGMRSPNQPQEPTGRTVTWSGMNFRTVLLVRDINMVVSPSRAPSSYSYSSRGFDGIFLNCCEPL